MPHPASRNYITIDLRGAIIRVHDLHGTLDRSFAAAAYPSPLDWIRDAECYATEAAHRLQCPYVCNY